jgi:tetratricopeptide (TPR) repeat protein
MTARDCTKAEFVAALRDAERWIDENTAEAQRWLPHLLDLDGPSLSAELALPPELRPGIIRLLLAVAQEACERSPDRAHELTAVLIEHTEWDAPPFMASLVSITKGQVWSAHASALRGLGRLLEALHAISVALNFLERGNVAAWYIAIAEVIEAQILHDMDQHGEALVLIRRAAETILLHGDRERYVQTRMIETSMRWDAGHHAAAGEVWSAAADEALQRGDRVLLAHFDNKIGIFQLRDGSAEEAARRFAAAHEAFDAAGLPREAARARWRLADATAARGRPHEAISEYYKVQALMLADGNVTEAALVSVEILEMLLIAGRHEEVLPLAEVLIDRFTEAELPWNAMQAWTFVEQRARTGRLTREEIAGVRGHFEELSLRPNAPFLPPEPGP